jgi:hypothetical protein
MKANGIKRLSCFNGGHTPLSYSLNSQLFALNVQLEKVRNSRKSMKQLYTFRHIRNVNLRVSVVAMSKEQARLVMSENGILHVNDNWTWWDVKDVPADWIP